MHLHLPQPPAASWDAHVRREKKIHAKPAQPRRSSGKPHQPPVFASAQGERRKRCEAGCSPVKQIASKISDPIPPQPESGPPPVAPARKERTGFGVVAEVTHLCQLAPLCTRQWPSSLGHSASARVKPQDMATACMVSRTCTPSSLSKLGAAITAQRVTRGQNF